MAKAETEFWLLDQDKTSRIFFYLLVLFLPTQFGKHFLVDFALVKGLRIDYLSPTLYFTDLLILGIFLFSLKKISKLIYKKYKHKFLLFSLFALFLLVGIFSSINYQSGLYIFIKLLEFIYLGVFAVIYFKTFNKKLLACLLGFGILFESSLAFSQYINQGSFQGMFYLLGERAFNGQTPGIANASINGSLVLRPYATFPHPNVLAGFINIALILFVYFGKQINLKYKVLIIALSCIGVLISFSRIGMLALTASIVIYFCITIFEKYKKGKSNPKYLVFVLITGLIVVSFFVLERNNIFAQRFFGLRISDESVQLRSLFVDQSIKMFLSHPVFGVGLGNFINNLGKIFIAHDQLQPVHNIFFMILSETGVVGFLTFLLVFKKMLLKAKNIYIVMLLVSLIIIGFFDHYLLTLQQGQILLTLLIATIMSDRG